MFRHKVFRYGKLHFRPYIPNQAVLFSGRIDEILTANDSVRIVNTVVDNLNLDNFKNLYKATGRCPYHPKMMLKVIIHAYMNNIYSCRKKEDDYFKIKKEMCLSFDTSLLFAIYRNLCSYT